MSSPTSRKDPPELLLNKAGEEEDVSTQPDVLTQDFHVPPLPTLIPPPAAVNPNSHHDDISAGGLGNPAPACSMKFNDQGIHANKVLFFCSPSAHDDISPEVFLNGIITKTQYKGSQTYHILWDISSCNAFSVISPESFCTNV